QLYSGGGTIAAMDRAEHGVTADHYDFFDREQRTLLDAVTAYMDVIFRRAAIDFNEANVKSLTEQLEAVRAALEVGERTLTDVAQVESRLARGKADLADALRDLETANANYVKVIGCDPGLIEEPKLLENLPKSKEELIALAQDADPRVLSAIYSEKSAKRQIDEDSAGLLPRVELTGKADRNLQVNGPNTHNNTASAILRLTVPVIQQGNVWSRSRQRVQQAAQARHNLDQARKLAREDAIKAWETWVAALQRIEHFKAQVKFSTLSRDGAILEAEVGERSYLDVLDAQTELLQAQLGLVQARRDEIVAEYQVLQSMGNLTAQYLQLPVERYKIEEHYESVRKKVFGWGDDPKYPAAMQSSHEEVRSS
ncbi:MAG: TolC family protein, partial [Pseudomonadota bacterium]